jgi:hypothetical protein
MPSSCGSLQGTTGTPAQATVSTLDASHLGQAVAVYMQFAGATYDVTMPLEATSPAVSGADNI